MIRYRYRVLPLPLTVQKTVNMSALEALCNEHGADEFELVTMSITDGIVVFQRDVYVERVSDEHIEQVLNAVNSNDDPAIMSLEFVISKGRTGSGGVMSGDRAMRYLIKRILEES